MVCPEDVLGLADVFPPVFGDMRVSGAAVSEERLDRVRDSGFTASRGFGLFGGVGDRGREDIHPDEREIRRWLIRLPDELGDATLVVGVYNPELLQAPDLL